MHNLDKFDRKILYELDLDARQTNKQISKKVKLSEQAVGYRINKLLEIGIIQEFLLLTNPIKLGYTHYKLYLRLQNCPEKEEKELEKFAISEKNVFWVAPTRGNYDYIISYLGKNLIDYKNFYDKLKNRFGQYIYSEELVLLTKAPLFNRSYLLEKSKKIEITYGGETKIEQIDKKDIAIIKSLSHNARKSYLEISKETKINPDTVRNHYKKLVEKNIITGTKLKLDFNKLGRKYALVSVTLQNFNEKILRDLELFAQGHESIIYYINCIGSHNVELEIEAKDDNEVDFIIKSFKDYFFQYIKNYSVLTVKKELKLDFVPF